MLKMRKYDIHEIFSGHKLILNFGKYFRDNQKDDENKAAEGDGSGTSDQKEVKEFLTLDEWKKLQGARQKPQYNLRKAGEGEDLTQWKNMRELQKKRDEEYLKNGGANQSAGNNETEEVNRFHFSLGISLVIFLIDDIFRITLATRFQNELLAKSILISTFIFETLQFVVEEVELYVAIDSDTKERISSKMKTLEENHAHL